ncbi:hypothetical protein OH77DRAFT_1511500 [Trametes cingulata]|nr:hypothetical protein OH77DRAFT_1511500 [Trametes cingulata]
MLKLLSRSLSRQDRSPGEPHVQEEQEGTPSEHPTTNGASKVQEITTVVPVESTAVSASPASKDPVAAGSDDEPHVQAEHTATNGASNVQERTPAASAASAHESNPAPTAPSQHPPASDASTTSKEPTPRSQKRFSWRSLVHPKGVQDRKPSLPPPREEAAKEATARQEYVEHQIVRTRSEKRAHESALVVRELIVGPFATPSAAPPKSAKVSASGVTSLQKIQKVKAQLLEPKSAQKVITQLRELPTSDVPIVVGRTKTGEPVKSLPKGPIHAVCLPYTDAEAHEKHFCRLDTLEAGAAPPASPNASPKAKQRSLDTSAASTATTGIASVTASSYEKLKDVLSDLNIVSLITAPDLGLGQPATGPGLFSGALPSADAIVDGIEQVTPQLMALGYATGKAILPSHAGIYPPTDRMSVITYWWGLEVVMPEPSVKYLSNVPSIAHTVINFLTALSVANGGVREILPFVRYISQYLDAEWRSIQQADQGRGVVCAATWLMPAALVPRPWDFPQPPVSPPPGEGDKPKGGDGATPSAPPASAGGPSSTSTAPTASSPTLLTPPLPEPNHAPVFVAPAGDPAVQAEGVRGNPAEGVPGVTVTPPTPPAAETLGKAAGLAVKAVVEATGAGAGAVGEVPAAVAAK